LGTSWGHHEDIGGLADIMEVLGTSWGLGDLGDVGSSLGQFTTSQGPSPAPLLALRWGDLGDILGTSGTLGMPWGPGWPWGRRGGWRDVGSGPVTPGDLVPVPQVDKGVVPLAGTNGETTTQGE